MQEDGWQECRALIYQYDESISACERSRWNPLGGIAPYSEKRDCNLRKGGLDGKRYSGEWDNGGMTDVAKELTSRSVKPLVK